MSTPCFPAFSHQRLAIPRLAPLLAGHFFIQSTAARGSRGSEMDADAATP